MPIEQEELNQSQDPTQKLELIIDFFIFRYRAVFIQEEIKEQLLKSIQVLEGNNKLFEWMSVILNQKIEPNLSEDDIVDLFIPSADQCDHDVELQEQLIAFYYHQEAWLLSKIREWEALAVALVPEEFEEESGEKKENKEAMEPLDQFMARLARLDQEDLEPAEYAKRKLQYIGEYLHKAYEDSEESYRETVDALLAFEKLNLGSIEYINRKREFTDAYSAAVHRQERKALVMTPKRLRQRELLVGRILEALEGAPKDNLAQVVVREKRKLADEHTLKESQKKGRTEEQSLREIIERNNELLSTTEEALATAQTEVVQTTERLTERLTEVQRELEHSREQLIQSEATVSEQRGTIADQTQQLLALREQLSRVQGQLQVYTLAAATRAQTLLHARTLIARQGQEASRETAARGEPVAREQAAREQIAREQEASREREAREREAREREVREREARERIAREREARREQAAQQVVVPPAQAPAVEQQIAVQAAAVVQALAEQQAAEAVRICHQEHAVRTAAFLQRSRSQGGR